MQLTAIYTTLKKLQVKDGVTVIVVALHTRNSRCFSSSVKNSSHIAKTMNLTTRACLFFWALIFQQSDLKLPTVAKNVKKWTVLTLSHGAKCVIHVIHLLSRLFSFL